MSALPEPAAVANPLLDAWTELVVPSPSDPFGWSSYRDERRWLDGRGPYPSWERCGRSRRQELVREYSWSVPSHEAIALVAALSPIVEIGAGTGYWASLAAALGADILAFDIKPPPANIWHKGARQHYPVRRGSVDLAARHADRTLLISWPPYDEPFASLALDAYVRAGGRRLVYIGEGYGGCCADDAFFARLGADRWDENEGYPPLEQGWRETHDLALPQWPGLHDRLWVYER